MHIGGMQKLTLLDYPGKVACTVFLSGCNLRCPYCHNPGLMLPDPSNAPGMPEAEVVSFLEQRKGKLDTNGTNPGMPNRLLRDGVLDYVAMDIKNSPSRYAETCGGVDVLSELRGSFDLLLDGPTDYEFRTTVCEPLHTEKEMEEIGRWLRGAKRYFLQTFVDTGDLVSGGVQAHTQDELTRLRQAVPSYIQSTQLRGI